MVLKFTITAIILQQPCYAEKLSFNSKSVIFLLHDCSHMTGAERTAKTMEQQRGALHGAEYTTTA